MSPEHVQTAVGGSAAQRPCLLLLEDCCPGSAPIPRAPGSSAALEGPMPFTSSCLAWSRAGPWPRPSGNHPWQPQPPTPAPAAGNVAPGNMEGAGGPG